MDMNEKGTKEGNVNDLGPRISRLFSFFPPLFPLFASEFSNSSFWDEYCLDGRIFFDPLTSFSLIQFFWIRIHSVLEQI